LVVLDEITPNALEIAIWTYLRRALIVAAGITDGDTAADIVQDAIANVVERRRYLRAGPVGPSLMKVVRRLAVHEVQQRQRRPVAMDETMLDLAAVIERQREHGHRIGPRPTGGRDVEPR
jgi:DNA-directed RNA polymerase specialized sigma24 family protein